MRVRGASDERGIALAVAVFALVVIGALVAGIFFGARLEQQSGTNTFFAAQAAEAAEAGLNDAVATQTAGALLALPIGADPANATDLGKLDVVANKVAAVRSVNRLTDNLFLLRSTGSRLSPGGGQLAAKSIGQLIRLVQADIQINAGLTALGNVTITGGAEVTGMDGPPPSWAAQNVDCPPTEDVAGVRYNNGTLSTSGNGTYDGDPKAVVDATLNASEMKEAFDKLKALATLTLLSSNPPETKPAHIGNPARCDTSVQSNWGEPLLNTDPCFDYFPIIYHYGNLKLQGGRGQGILLVEGDLTATGGMVFYGPVFVTGTLSTSGNSNQGAKFYGGVIAGNVDLDDVTKLAGGALVSYSSCAIGRALQYSATPTPLAERSWVQLYQ